MTSSEFNPIHCNPLLPGFLALDLFPTTTKTSTDLQNKSTKMKPLWKISPQSHTTEAKHKMNYLGLAKSGFSWFDVLVKRTQTKSWKDHQIIFSILHSSSFAPFPTSVPEKEAIPNFFIPPSHSPCHHHSPASQSTRTQTLLQVQDKSCFESSKP